MLYIYIYMNFLLWKSVIAELRCRMPLGEEVAAG